MLLILCHTQPDQPPTEDLIVAFPCSIGTAAQNTIVVADPTVAEYHAVIDQQNGKLVFRDLGTGSATTFDGQPLAELVLDDNVTVHLGKVRVDLMLHQNHEQAVSAADPRGHITRASTAHVAPAVGPTTSRTFSPRLMGLTLGLVTVAAGAVLFARQAVFPVRERAETQVSISSSGVSTAGRTASPVADLVAAQQNRAAQLHAVAPEIKPEASARDSRQPASVLTGGSANIQLTAAATGTTAIPAVVPELHPTVNLKPAPPVNATPHLTMTNPPRAGRGVHTPIEALKLLFQILPPWAGPGLLVVQFLLLVFFQRLFTRGFLLKRACLAAGAWSVATGVCVYFGLLGAEVLKFNLDSLSASASVDTGYGALVLFAVLLSVFAVTIQRFSMGKRVVLALAIAAMQGVAMHEHFEHSYLSGSGFMSGLSTPLRGFDASARSEQVFQDSLDQAFRRIANDRPREFEFLYSSMTED